ncbi:hypothetical protein M758_1G327800 [Ceratodon purpureus]|nr:hypothetical protein M758_1G327800 [Ceratodon purpureus]
MVTSPFHVGIHFHTVVSFGNPNSIFRSDFSPVFCHSVKNHFYTIQYYVQCVLLWLLGALSILPLALFLLSACSPFVFISGFVISLFHFRLPIRYTVTCMYDCC